RAAELSRAAGAEPRRAAAGRSPNRLGGAAERGAGAPGEAAAALRGSGRAGAACSEAPEAAAGARRPPSAGACGAARREETGAPGLSRRTPAGSATALATTEQLVQPGGQGVRLRVLDVVDEGLASRSLIGRNVEHQEPAVDLGEGRGIDREDDDRVQTLERHHEDAALALTCRRDAVRLEQGEQLVGQ